jgi:hypothetical protein
MSRWFKNEEELLVQMKARLKDDIEQTPQYEDVVGERRMMRFLRGQKYNLDDAVRMFRDFLNWRKLHNVDDVRNDILYNGKNQATRFPKADIILRLLPQVVIAPNARDNRGQPVVYEELGYHPGHIFDEITVEDLTTFLIYGLEFRAMILEQLSKEEEREYLKLHPDPAQRSEGYGVMAKLCVIRNLDGVGFEHLGSNFKTILKKFIDLAARKLDLLVCFH